MNERRSPALPIVQTVLGGGAAMVVVALFLTGVAQREIVPRIRARAEEAITRSTAALRPAPAAETEVPADTVAAAPQDSLSALRVQIETERVFLEAQKQELAQMRAGVDSAMAERRRAQGTELGRQAKLLAGMKPVEAARILAAMDDASVAALLAKMNARAASKVMAQLDATRVARLALAAIGDAPAEAAPGTATESVR